MTRPSRSIIKQSFDARERLDGDASTPGYLNGDGFGLGWYSQDSSDVIPCVYKHTRPAWNDRNLAAIAEKIVTPLLFAHVRAASPGMDVSESTCHPFRFGRYLWMHNGGVANFRRVRRALLAGLNDDVFDFAVSHGSSDTAVCFAVFMSLVPDPMAKSTPNELRHRLEETIRIVVKAIIDADTADLSLLNFVVSDGDSLVASRCAIDPSKSFADSASLYFAAGSSYKSNQSSQGSFSMVHTSRQPKSVIISSEPLTEERSDWVSVPNEHIIVITPTLHITISPFNNDGSTSISNVLNNLENFRRLRENRKGALTPNTSTSQLTLTGLRSPSILSLNPQKAAPPRSAHRSLPYVLGSSGLYPNDYQDYFSKFRFAVSIPNRSILSMTVVGSFLCFGMDDGSIQVYDLDNSHVLKRVSTSHGAVMALLGDNERSLVISACSSSTLCVWRLSSSGVLELLHVLTCDGMGVILDICFVGKSVFAGFSDTLVRCVIEDIDVIPTPRNEELRTNQSNSEQWNSNVSSDLVSSDVPCEMLRKKNSFPTSKVCSQQHFGFVFAVASCDHGSSVVTGCGDGIVRVWDRISGECKYYREGHSGAVSVLEVYEGKNGTILFSGSRDRTFKAWDVNSGFICKRTIRKHKADIVFLAVSGDKLFSGSSDGLIHSWCPESLRYIGLVRDSMLLSGAVSSKYQLVFSGSDIGVIYARDAEAFSEKNAVPKSNTYKAGATSLESLDNTNRKPKRPNLMLGAISTGAVMTLPDRGGKIDNTNEEDDNSEDDSSTLVYGLANNVVLSSPPTLVELTQDEDLNTPINATTALEHHAIDPSSERNKCDEANGIHEDNSKQLDSLAIMPSSDVSMSEDSLNADARDKDETGESVGGCNGAQTNYVMEGRLLQDVLARFVSYATVSGVEEYREDCWRGAKYIGSFLEGLGASVKYVPTSHSPKSRHGRGLRTARSPNGMASSFDETLSSSATSGISSTNPIVLARFASVQENAPTLAFYGHYDVMPADSAKWDSDPWTLTTLNGRFYGRGVTDNKGPILAMIFAIRNILNMNKDCLSINIVLVLEGEGEMSNSGFQQCIEAYKEWFQRTMLILTSNAYWLGEERPCITYGMRGVVDLDVRVSGPSRNLHSGVDGGAVFEPVNDLLAILGTLVDSSGVSRVRGFYDDVRPLSIEDMKRLRDVQFDLAEYCSGTGVSKFVSDKPDELLELRWRRPSLSVTSLQTSNSTGLHSVVPREATAKISIRFVPDQSAEQMETVVRDHLNFELLRRRSPNSLQVICGNHGDTWLGDPSDKHFQVAAKAVRDVWGVEPQYVCEGGTMPIFSFLSKTLNAPILQVPLGQSSDGAHLPNERIRIMNLRKGQLVLQKIIEALCNKGF